MDRPWSTVQFFPARVGNSALSFWSFCPKRHSTSNGWRGNQHRLGSWLTRVLRPSGWGKGAFPVKTATHELVVWVLMNLDSCKQEGGVRLGNQHRVPLQPHKNVFWSFPWSLRRPWTVATMAQGSRLKYRAQLREKRYTLHLPLGGVLWEGTWCSVKPVNTI